MTFPGSVRLAAVAAACALGSGGCAAAGLAAMGPVLGALQIVSDRSVDRTIVADLPAALSMTEAAMGRVAIAPEARKRLNDGWLVRGVGRNLTAEITLAPVTERLTRIGVRVETGGLTADKQTAEALHDQIALILREYAEPVRHPPAGSGEAMSALEAQVESLRTELARQRQASTAPPRTAPAPMPVMTIDASAVVSVPASYGFVMPSAAAGAETPPAPPPVAETPRLPVVPLPSVQASRLEAVGTLPVVPALGITTE